MILGLFSELLEVGGIQRINQHAASSLIAFAKLKRHPCRLLSLNDPVGLHQLNMGGSVYTIEGFGRKKSRFVFATLLAGRKACLVYIGHVNMSPLGLLVKGLNRRSKFCVATYGTDVWDPLPPVHRYALQSAYGITALSGFTGERLVSVQEVDAMKVAIVPPALDPLYLRYCERSSVGGKTPRRRILLTVARLDAREKFKGIDTVIQCMPDILNRCPDVLYVVVGDGDDRGRLEKLARERGISEHVVFAGRKSGEALSEFYAKCDIFVMPSSQEGFGVVFLEAMAFGKPVIGGTNGGTPEVVREGVTGLLVDFGDVAGLTNKIIVLLDNSQLRKEMGEAGRLRVMSYYAYERFSERLSELWDKGGLCKS